jgi:CubicO group peptidase (beta-lactamase class C family)
MPVCALRHSFIAALLAGLATTAAAAAVATPAPAPAAGTAPPVSTTPAALGIDAAPLAALDADLASGKFPLVDSLLVMRCGQVVFDRRYPHDYAATYGKEAHTKGPLNARLTGPYNYFDPAWHPYYQGTDEHTMQSVSKTVTSAIIGVAMARGAFKSPLSTPVLHYFDPEKVKNVDARKRRMTLRDLLTMTSGLDWNEDVPYADPNNPSDLMEAADDWVQFVIDRPMKDEPGSVFAYSSGATELLAYIFKRETGVDIEEYGRSHLFKPLGIKDYHWKRTPLGVVDTEGGLYLRAEDLAKIGLLYLNGGRWEGQPLMTADWVKESLTPRIDAGEGFQYGYQWWLLPHGDPKRLAWLARGMGGQRLIIIPEEHLIVVSTAWHILNEASIEFDVVRRVLPGVHPHECTPPTGT